MPLSTLVSNKYKLWKKYFDETSNDNIWYVSRMFSLILEFFYMKLALHAQGYTTTLHDSTAANQS